MVQDLRPLPLGRGLLHECRQEVGIGMLKALKELPIFDCRLMIAPMADRFSLQPLEYDFG
jgi:hypothetical protein